MATARANFCERHTVFVCPRSKFFFFASFKKGYHQTKIKKNLTSALHERKFWQIVNRRVPFVFYTNLHLTTSQFFLNRLLGNTISRLKIDDSRSGSLLCSPLKLLVYLENVFLRFLRYSSLLIVRRVFISLNIYFFFFLDSIFYSEVSYVLYKFY